MVIPRSRPVNCTLCGAGFSLVTSSMIHPADVLCDACIVDLWGSTESDAALKSRCEARISPNLGMSPDMVADGILQRVVELREIAHDRREVDNLLAQRAGNRR